MKRVQRCRESYLGRKTSQILLRAAWCAYEEEKSGGQLGKRAGKGGGGGGRGKGKDIGHC